MVLVKAGNPKNLRNFKDIRRGTRGRDARGPRRGTEETLASGDGVPTTSS